MTAPGFNFAILYHLSMSNSPGPSASIRSATISSFSAFISILLQKSSRIPFRMPPGGPRMPFGAVCGVLPWLSASGLINAP